MSFLLVRSVPLSRETREAWKSQGGRFLKRSRNGKAPASVVDRHEFVINLGCVDYNTDSDVACFNSPTTIRSVSHPVRLRETLGDLGVLPEASIKGAHWHKNGGWRGRGKTFHEGPLGECAVISGDVQEHVEGVEYRVVTVGELVVQAHRKERDGVSGDFDWYWCGVDGVRSNGIIPLVKKAVANIPDGEFSVFGWDIMVDETAGCPVILEVNTSPGVNLATAERVINGIRKMF